MDSILEESYLFDFYGELLTEHQRAVFEEVVLNDISYSEAAEDLGVSRQGVHDLVKRCNSILEGYEDKLQLVKRFLSIREKAQQICTLSSAEGPQADAPSADQESIFNKQSEINRLAKQILEEL